MPNGNNIDYCKWITCLAAMAVVVLAALILAKMDKPEGYSSKDFKKDAGGVGKVWKHTGEEVGSWFHGI